MSNKEKVLTYKLKKTLPSQSKLHSKYGWYNSGQYYRREFIELIKENKVPKYKAFAIELNYNTGHDCDNLAPFAKFFVDTFRELKRVKNDTKEFYKYLKLIPDESLPKKTLQFKIIPIEDAN